MKQIDMVFETLKNLVPKQDYLKLRNDGEFLIVLNTNAEFQYLNATAKDIYIQCDGKKTIKDIYEYMLDEYDVDCEVMKHDIISVIREFQWKNLIVLKKLNIN